VDIVWKLIATVGLVVLNGYFVAAEFAAVGARTSRLEVLAQSSWLAKLAVDVKKRLDLYLSTCQLGITIASLGLGYITEPAIAALLEQPLERLGFAPPGPHAHHPIAIVIALTISTTLHVVVGEVAPKNWAIFFSDKLLPILAPPLIFFTYLFYPAIWALNAASNVLLRISGINIEHGTHHGLPHTADELRMTPRTQVDYLTIDQPIREVLRVVQQSEFTRFPLCEEDIDHVIGLVHMKDLFNHLKLIPGRLRFTDEKTPDGEAIAIPNGLPGSAVHVIGTGDIDLREIRRDILFVPELLDAPKLLRQFQNSHIHMAIVVDEYGATRGIVTLEDVVEEIVGEIEDEFDTGEQPAFIAEGENYRVNGLFPMRELREKLLLDGIELGDVDTLNGYIIQQLGRWPKPGDTVPLGPYTARVISVSQKRVGQVLITPITQEDARIDGPGKV